MAVLVVIGWRTGPGMSPEDLLLLRKTNLTTLMIWGLWWPGMIALTLLLGRAWCTVCPMELANRAAEALARRLALPRVRLSRWLRAGWFMLLAYFALQILVAGISIHRVPHYTSLMLLSFFGLALVTGLLIREQRSFCKGFCPAGVLLSVYGRYTPVQLDIRNPEVCSQCKTRDCTAQANRFRFDRKSCPSLLRPYARKQSDGCVLCFQCAKVCPYENIGFGIVRHSAGSRRHRILKPYEAAFIMVAAGFVAHEVIGEVKWLDEIFHALPNTLHTLAPSIGFNWFEAFWYLCLFPAILWTLVAGLARILGHRSGLKSLLLAAATGAAPVIAVAHLAKAAAKFSSWIGFVRIAVPEPRGISTFHRIMDQALPAPSPVVSLSVLGWLMFISLVIVGWRSRYWARDVAEESLSAARAGFVAMVAVFSVVLLIWQWQ